MQIDDALRSENFLLLYILNFVDEILTLVPTMVYYLIVFNVDFTGKSWRRSDEEIGQVKFHRHNWERMDLFNSW